MADVVAPEDMLGASTEPLDIDVRCMRCSTEAAVRVSWAIIDPRVTRGVADGWDGVALSQIFTCTSCGTLDEYEVSDASYRRLTREMNSAVGGSRVIRGVTRLWDGTEARRPAAALAHLRALAATRPTSAEAWRRLGNFCERYELTDESMAAWRKAVEVGPEEFEAAYSLAAQLFADAVDEITADAVRFLRAALSRFAAISACRLERRPTFGEALAALLFELADASDVPIVLLASWASGSSKGDPVVTMSSAELARVERRDTLGEFLARTDLLALDLVEESQSDELTNLEQLLDAEDDNERRAIERYLRAASEPLVPVRAAPRPGRNDPCPCGSGTKYKKCHGR